MPTGIGATIVSITDGTTAHASDVLTSLNNLNSAGVSNDSGNISTDGAGTMTLVGLIATALKSNPTAVNVAGTTAGSANLYQFLQGTIKAAIIQWNGYRNSTATEQKLALPVAFTFHALFLSGNIPIINIYSGGSQVLSHASSVDGLSSSGGSSGGYSAGHLLDFGEFTAAFDTIGLGTSQATTYSGLAFLVGI